jgi:hypothetical protein
MRTPMAVATSMFVILVALHPASAAAATGYPGATCANGGNIGSSGCVNHAYGDVYGGGFVYFQNMNMQLDQAHYDRGYHINQEMWLYTRADERQFIGIGIHMGVPIGMDPCVPLGCKLAYEVFWEDYDPLGNENDHYIGNANPGDQTWHSYEVQRRSDNVNNWDVFYDFNYYGTSTVVLSSVAYEMQTGLEVSSCHYVGCNPADAIGPWASSQTFYDTSQQTRNSNNYGWNYWTYMNNHVDYPCGPNPPGYCLNGVMYSHTD